MAKLTGDHQHRPTFLKTVENRISGTAACLAGLAASGGQSWLLIGGKMASARLSLVDTRHHPFMLLAHTKRMCATHMVPLKAGMLEIEQV